VLGVAEAKLGNAISDGLSVPCACNEFTGELLRGVRAHAGHLTKVHPFEAASKMCLLYLFDMGAIDGDSAVHSAHGSLPCHTSVHENSTTYRSTGCRMLVQTVSAGSPTLGPPLMTCSPLAAAEPGDGGGVEGAAGAGALLFPRQGQVQRQPPGQHDHPGAPAFANFFALCLFVSFALCLEGRRVEELEQAQAGPRCFTPAITQARSGWRTCLRLTRAVHSHKHMLLHDLHAVACRGCPVRAHHLCNEQRCSNSVVHLWTHTHESKTLRCLDTLGNDVHTAATTTAKRTLSWRSIRTREASFNLPAQAIALLDTLDKDVNTFVMRVREWYSWHFPELVRIVPDNYTYARLALAIQEKGSLSDDRKEELSDITGALPFKTL